MKIVKIVAMVLVGLGIVAAIVYGFLPKPVPSEFATASTGDIRVTIDEEGQTRVKDRFDVLAPLPGMITRITLKEGDVVEIGTPIATLKPSQPQLLDARAREEAAANAKAAEAAVEQADANVHAAQAQLDIAEKERKRIEKLKAPEQVSREQVEVAMLKEAAAKANLASAQFAKKVAGYQSDMAKAALVEDNAGTKLPQIDIRSPVSGRVLHVYRQSEGAVQAGQTLVELGDPASLEVVVDLLSSDAVRVKPGMKVSIERWGGPQPLEGFVRLVEPGGFTKYSSLGVEEQRVNVVIDFSSPREKWQRLGDAFRVEARVILSEHKDVLKVPAGALFDTPDGDALFVVVHGDAEQRVVKVGERNGLEAEIEGGLNEGDKVIVHPSDEISDGSPVEER